MKLLRSVGTFLKQHLTFKRIIILFIVFSLMLPIYKSLFWSDDSSLAVGNGYEYTYLRGDELSMNKVLQVSINGVILTEETSVAGPFDFLEEGVTYGYEVKEQLRRAAKDESIKAVFLTINSPGGTIPGSQAISDGVALYKRETGNPVYAHIRDVGASGGYWAAVSTDKIFADTGSLIGSIGVIMGPFTYYNNPIEEGGLLGGVTTEGGIEHTYITGGEYKDTGSPYRRMTPEERTHWQDSVNNEYSLFVNYVSARRDLTPDYIRTTIKALPYDTIQAKNLGLIDEISSEDIAIEALLDKAGLGNDYQLLEEESKGDFFSDIFGVISDRKSPQVTSPNVCSLCNTPLFLYDRTYSLFQ